MISGTGHEISQRRQILDAVQPEAFDEQGGGAVEHRLARTGIPADLGDETPGLKGAEGPFRADTPDGRDLGSGYRLLVRHDGQRLQRRGREAGGLAFEHEPLDVGRQILVALEAVAAGDAHQLEAPVLVAVRRLQLGAELLDPARRHLEQLGQHARLDRRFGHHDDRLYGSMGLRRHGC